MVGGDTGASSGATDASSVLRTRATSAQATDPKVSGNYIPSIDGAAAGASHVAGRPGGDAATMSVLDAAGEASGINSDVGAVRGDVSINSASGSAGAKGASRPDRGTVSSQANTRATAGAVSA